MDKLEGTGVNKKKYLILGIILILYILFFSFGSSPTILKSSPESGIAKFTGYVNVQSSQQITATVTRSKQPYWLGLINIYNYKGNTYFGNLHRFVIYGMPILLIGLLSYDLMKHEKKSEVNTNGKEIYNPNNWSDGSGVPARYPGW